MAALEPDIRRLESERAVALMFVSESDALPSVFSINMYSYTRHLTRFMTAIMPPEIHHQQRMQQTGGSLTSDICESSLEQKHS